MPDVAAKIRKGSMLKMISITMMLCVGLLGCKGVEPSDLTGIWVLNDESRHRFLSDVQQKAAAKIVLNANGTFRAFEIPEDLLYAPPQVGAGLVTGNGVWKLFSIEGKQQVQLSFKTITVGQRGKVPYGTQLNVSRGWSAVRLYYFQGDADEGRIMEFEKKEGGSQQAYRGQIFTVDK